MAFRYVYMNAGMNESQYDDIDLSVQKTVEARYVHDFVAPGNPFVEALPQLKSDTALVMEYNRAVRVPTQEQLDRMNLARRVASVSAIKEFRIPLPFYLQAEEYFSEALHSAYGAKVWDERGNTDVQLTIGDEQVSSCGISRVARVSEPAVGFALVGTSGCGKSTCINMILDRYPQVIIHAKGTPEQRYQILYIHVNCQPNSNFKVLYTEIGHEIDRALGNTSPVYEEQIRKAGSLGAKMAWVRRLIEAFSIGVIILDEIELIDLNSTKENSYEAIMTLTNETGTAIIAVGTTDAYEKLFNKRRTARRIGHIIHASSYCGNRKRFGYIVKQLSCFQWRKQPVVYTEEMIDAMYEWTGGIISDLIVLYKSIEQNYLKGKEKSGLSPEYIRKIAKENSQELHFITMKEHNPMLNPKSAQVDEELKRIEMLFDDKDEEDRIEAERRYDERMVSEDFADLQVLETEVLTEILTKTDKYTQRQIEAAFHKIMESETERIIPTNEAVRKTLKHLKDRADSRKSAGKQKKADINKLKTSLLANQEAS